MGTTPKRTELRHLMLATAEDFEFFPGTGHDRGQYHRTEEARKAGRGPYWPTGSETRTLFWLSSNRLTTEPVPAPHRFNDTRKVLHTRLGRDTLQEWNGTHGDPTRQDAGQAQREDDKHMAEQNDNEDMITIPRRLYEELVRDAAFLERLEAAGVDNWEGYSNA